MGLETGEWGSHSSVGPENGIKQGLESERKNPKGRYLFRTRVFWAASEPKSSALYGTDDPTHRGDLVRTGGGSSQLYRKVSIFTERPKAALAG